jgi:allantoin racemase
MRIALVNSNTSDFVTQKVAAGARAAASPATEIVAVTSSFGARVIASRSENAVAEHATILLAAQNAETCDAIVIAVSYDTGLRGARELLSIPVVGMTEAALLTACMLGGKVGIIVFGRHVLPMYQELVASYALAGRIAGWRALESAVPYSPGATDELDRALIEASRDLIDVEGAEVIILAGAVMAGVPGRLQPSVPVPVLDGISCGVRQAELLVRLGAPKPTRGSYAHPGNRELVETDPAIARLFRRDR